MYSLFFAQLAFAENLEVTSDLVGGAILVNGVETVYRTPATLTGIAPGLVTITVEKDCNRGQVQANVVQGKSTTKVHIMTSEEQGTLAVHADPVGARILLDGQAFGGPSGAPVGVACGEHSIRVEYDGYAAQTIPVDITNLNLVDVPVSLKKLGYASIELSVTPRTAAITLDGKPIGSDYVVLPSVTEGNHVIGAELDGYQTISQRLHVKAGTTLSYQIKMKSKRSGRQGIIVPMGSNSEKAMMASTGATPTAQVTPTPIPEEEADKAAEAARKKEEEEAEAREAEEREAKEREAEAARKKEEEDEEREAEAARKKEEEVEEREAEAARKKEEEDEEREAEAARRKEEAVARAEAESKSRSDKSKNPATLWSGVGLMGASVAGGAGAFLTYNATIQAQRQAEAKAEAAQDNRKLKDEAEAAQSEYETRRTVFYATAGLTGALLTTGVVLVLVDDGPSLTLIPGGMLLSWHVQF